jgi:FkbM family methyltransferase
MNVLRKLAKSAWVYRAQQHVIPLKDISYIGSTYQGYYVPSNYLSGTSICYCVGAGTDISLDVELATRFKSQVFIIDPMPYAKQHFDDLVQSVKVGSTFTADYKKEGYVYNISAKDLGNITYCATGVWDEKKTVKFYVPASSNYAGHSITNLQNTEDYIEAPVDKLANIMRELGHQQIDLLKIEIEGSEYTVIDDVLADNLDVKMILVEFDEFHHRKGLSRLVAVKHIEHSSRKLMKAGYKLAHSISFYKRTFIRADVMAQLATS